MAYEQILGYDKAGNRTREQIDANVNSATFNNVNQLTAQSPGVKMEFTGALNEFATLTLKGATDTAENAATVDSSNNWRGTADVTTGANSIALVATDASGNSTTHTIGITVTGNAARTLTYDLNGNLLNNGDGQTYTWDAANRLIQITYSDGSYSTFVYNGLGQRVQIMEKDASGNTTSDKHFVWAGGAQPAEERDASNTVTKRFYGMGEEIGGVSYFYTTDHLGSIRELTDSTKAIRARYEYDPYGRLTKVSGDLEADFGFTGFYRHTASGLDLTLYRAYDTALGRWISRDPIGENGGLNLYGYVNANPINLVDHLGLIWGIISFDLRGGEYGKDFELYNNILQIPETTNTFQVAMHGNAYNVYEQGVRYLEMDADDLAEQIINNSKYVKGMPVTLYSCETGDSSQNNPPFAQQLAQKLGVSVTAPSSIISVDNKGNVSFDNGGGWVTFTPQQ